MLRLYDRVCAETQHAASLQWVEGDMTLFRGKFRIETARLRGWDYGAYAWYFVTICTHNRTPYLGDVANGSVVLSPVGRIAEGFWRAISAHFPDAEIDDFVIMPDHLHGIVIIGRERANSAKLGPASIQTSNNQIKAGSLPAVVRSFKSAVTRWCVLNGYTRHPWQARYYDRIIRRAADLERFRAYMANNPLEWNEDQP